MQEKYSEIWDTMSNMKNKFDSEPVYNDKYIKTKIKSYEGKMNTNFHGNKVLREGSQYIFLSAILIDPVNCLLEVAVALRQLNPNHKKGP